MPSDFTSHSSYSSEAVPVSAAVWALAEDYLRSERFASGMLRDYVRGRRWFGGKAFRLRCVRVRRLVSLGTAGRLALIEADYENRPPESYVMPLQLIRDADAETIATFAGGEGTVGIIDGLEDERFRSALFEIILHEKRLPDGDGEIRGVCGAALREAGIANAPVSRALRAEQSNSAILYDDRFFLKLYRRPEPGENPDAEMLRFLSERQRFAHVPAFCGAVEWRSPGVEPLMLALQIANVPNDGDAWTFTLDSLREFFERAISRRPWGASGSSSSTK